ncbi:MAG: hypothetical protein U0892_16705 [Pirellulales bacterium]
MRRRPKEINFEQEFTTELSKIESLVGHENDQFALLLGAKPTLVSVDGNFALLRFPNGAWLKDVRVSRSRG